ncbi:uncharacterized protein LOC111048186 [Nilaparvata lugens]|uniref:uncharacterized protein LOC111048186 n=1 Tax=Nilaparvata lugens TaxID=108931 RepID=UPI00193C8866|nr:uncharacterized protein LOC111048186 [Nilaparvata lugens]
MVDERRDFILKTAGNYYGINDLEPSKSERSIEEFLDNIDCLTLIIKKQNEGSELEFSNEVNNIIIP